MLPASNRLRRGHMGHVAINETANPIIASAGPARIRARRYLTGSVRRLRATSKTVVPSKIALATTPKGVWANPRDRLPSSRFNHGAAQDRSFLNTMCILWAHPQLSRTRTASRSLQVARQRQWLGVSNPPHRVDCRLGV